MIRERERVSGCGSVTLQSQYVVPPLLHQRFWHFVGMGTTIGGETGAHSEQRCSCLISPHLGHQHSPCIPRLTSETALSSRGFARNRTIAITSRIRVGLANQINAAWTFRISRAPSIDKEIATSAGASVWLIKRRGTYLFDHQLSVAVQLPLILP
jgi:hypothetical protein